MKCQDGKPLTTIQTLITGVKAMIFVGFEIVLLVLPKNMSTRQWGAHTGLDPCQFNSG